MTRQLSPVDAEVIVAGGGPVGAMLCLALQAQGVRFLHVRGETRGGERPIALSFGSRQLIERYGAWPEATPIASIHISQAGGFGRTLIRADEYGLPALGYVTPYSLVLAALSVATTGEPGLVKGWQARGDSVTVHIEASGGTRSASARLLVLADGGDGTAKEKTRDYRQAALVAEIRASRPHGNVAWERFTPGGPIALLPYRDCYALVWTCPGTAADTLLHADESEFLDRLQTEFGRRAGRFLRAGPRTSFPLTLRYRDIAPGRRVILIGNAAQSLHPVAGQGLNLGLRDACELADLIASAHTHEIGDPAFVRRYRRERRLDRRAGIIVTDSLVRVFSNSNPLLRPIRGAGLALLDILPPARRFLARRMIYGARALP